MRFHTSRIDARRRGALLVISGFMALGFLAPARAASLDLTPYRGKVVYVDFWASWCGPCRESFPWLAQLMRTHSGGDFVVIGVNVDKDRSRAERFLSETPAAFPLVYDPNGELATAYKITGMPSGMIIDRSGHVRFQHSGFSAKKKDEYEAQVQSLLDEPHP